jgi:hypothetical protein
VPVTAADGGAGVIAAEREFARLTQRIVSTPCDSGYTGNKTKTYNSSCSWGGWSTSGYTAKTACSAMCPMGETRNTSVSYSKDEDCCTSKTACPTTCSEEGQKRSSFSYSEDGEYCVAKTACSETCPAGQRRDWTVNYSDDGACCKNLVCQFDISWSTDSVVTKTNECGAPQSVGANNMLSVVTMEFQHVKRCG